MFRYRDGSPIRLELSINCHHAFDDQDRRTERARAPQEKYPSEKSLRIFFLRSETEVEPVRAGNVKQACSQSQWLS